MAAIITFDRDSRNVNQRIGTPRQADWSTLVLSREIILKVHVIRIHIVSVIGYGSFSHRP